MDVLENPTLAEGAPVTGDSPSHATESNPGGENAVQQAEKGVEGQGATAPGNVKPRTQAYIAELNRKKHEAERRAEASEAANRALTKQLQEAHAKRQRSDDPAEIISRVAEDAISKGRATALAQSRDDALAEAAALEKQAWHAKAADARMVYPDFDQVLNNDDLAISPDMARTLRELPRGADLAYYLGKNPEKAEEIFSLPSRSQASALTLLISELPSAKAAVQAKTSGAPAPVGTVTGKAGGQKAPLDSLSYEEYKKQRAGGRVS